MPRMPPQSQTEIHSICAGIFPTRKKCEFRHILGDTRVWGLHVIFGSVEGPFSTTYEERFDGMLVYTYMVVHTYCMFFGKNRNGTDL